MFSENYLILQGTDQAPYYLFQVINPLGRVSEGINQSKVYAHNNGLVARERDNLASFEQRMKEYREV